MDKYKRKKLLCIISMIIIIVSLNTHVKAQGVNNKFPFKNLFSKDKQKTIIVDPGHNYGRGDTGARAKHEDILYIERDLNMSVSIALKDELEKLGYKVILTREPWQRDISSLDDSLSKRINIGNSSNADFFISIHHDGSKNKDTCGVSAFYSSWKPDIDEGEEIPGYCCPRYGKYEFTMSLTPTKEAVKGKEIAVNLVNELSRKLEFNNIGAHDRNLRVTKAVNIPSVLVECGFITNQDEAKKCADRKHQREVAKIIAEVIGIYIINVTTINI